MRLIAIALRRRLKYLRSSYCQNKMQKVGQVDIETRFGQGCILDNRDTCSPRSRDREHLHFFTLLAFEPVQTCRTLPVHAFIHLNELQRRTTRSYPRLKQTLKREGFIMPCDFWHRRLACVRNVLSLKVMTDKRCAQSHQNSAASFWHQPTGPVATHSPKSQRGKCNGCNIG